MNEEQIRQTVRCIDDKSFFINEFCFTYDPRLGEGQRVLRFTLWDTQRELLDWMQEREAKQEPGIIKKSRNSGVTWLCCAYALHAWLFRPESAVGFGSRKEMLVDRLGDMDSIFEKIRFMLYRLPGWMKPQGFGDDFDNYMRLLNPENGAAITGEAGDGIGRGGRKSLYFVDESAFLANPKSVEASLSETTECRIDVSTVNGAGNVFAEKLRSGKIPVFSFHWKRDPRKNLYFIFDSNGNKIGEGRGEAPKPSDGGRVEYPWYEKKKRELPPVVVAQEIDMDITADVDNVLIPAKWVQAAVNLQLPLGSVSESGLDIAGSGDAENVYVHRRGSVVTRMKAWREENPTRTAWRAIEYAEEDGATLLKYDSVGVGQSTAGAIQDSERKTAVAIEGLNGASSPTRRKYDDNDKIPANERFLNLRAEMYWNLRLRFQRTYEHVEGIRPALEDEMISIPNDEELIVQLSQPTYATTSTGKIKVESKDDMRKRGVKSPDRADGLVYVFYAGKPKPQIVF